MTGAPVGDRFRRGSGQRRAERGQALVETAIITPILFLLILGVMDLAGAWRSYQVVTDLAREGARVVVAGGNKPTQAQAETAIRERLWDSGICPRGMTQADCTTSPQFTICWNPSPDCPDNPGTYDTSDGIPTSLYLQYRYRFRFLQPVLLISGNNEVWFKTLFTMRNERS